MKWVGWITPFLLIGWLAGGILMRTSKLAAKEAGKEAGKAERVDPVQAHTDRMEPSPKDLEDVGIDEKLGGVVPLHLAFTEADGQVATLGQYFTKGQPVILTLNYSNCPMLCNLQLDGFVEALRHVHWTAGQQFQIVSVSIDPNEDPQRFKSFKEKYLAQYARPVARQGWHFLRGNEASIQSLADAVGFKYQYVASRKEYAHAAALMIASPQGKISRYLYGVMYEPRDVRFGLLEAAEGKVGSAVDRILLYCFHYDATQGRYAPMATRIMRLGGAVTVVVLAGILAVFWTKDARKTRIPFS